MLGSNTLTDQSRLLYLTDLFAICGIYQLDVVGYNILEA